MVKKRLQFLATKTREQCQPWPLLRYKQERGIQSKDKEVAKETIFTTENLVSKENTTTTYTKELPFSGLISNSSTPPQKLKPVLTKWWLSPSPSLATKSLPSSSPNCQKQNYIYVKMDNKKHRNRGLIEWK